jgi:1-acyl-sn-glycerol-3-phosphate acyltransferase
VRRKHPKLDFWLRFAWCIAIPPTSALFRRTYRDIERVPEQGKAIIAVNHLSYIDPLLVIRFVYDSGRVPRFLAKSGLFKIFVFGRMLFGTGQIPVYRDSASAGDSLRDAEAALAQGDVVVIYPEGTVTRDPDWWPMRAMTGAARLALSTDTPVIPVAHWGAQYSVDWYAKRFRPIPRKKVVFQAGPPVDLSAYKGKPLTASLLRDATDDIMRAVRAQLAEIRGETPPEGFSPRPVRADKPAKKKKKKAKKKEKTTPVAEEAPAADEAPAEKTAPVVEEAP